MEISRVEAIDDILDEDDEIMELSRVESIDSVITSAATNPMAKIEAMEEDTKARSGEIGGRASRLDLGQRDLNLFDLRRLVHLLRDEFGVEITGLYARPAAIHLFAERELKLKLFPLTPTFGVEDTDEVETEEARVVFVEDLLADGPPPEAEELNGDDEVEEPPLEPELVPADPAPVPSENAAPEEAAPAEEPPGRRTLHVHRTLRSGTAVRFDGDVIVFGDVNPGAQVEAAGNILVLGALKGMAHAGATGDEETFILGFDMRPIQLRVGRRIAILPEGRRSTGPEMAAVVDGQIIIESYRGPIFR